MNKFHARCSSTLSIPLVIITHFQVFPMMSKAFSLSITVCSPSRVTTIIRGIQHAPSLANFATSQPRFPQSQWESLHPKTSVSDSPQNHSPHCHHWKPFPEITDFIIPPWPHLSLLHSPWEDPPPMFPRRLNNKWQRERAVRSTDMDLNTLIAFIDRSWGSSAEKLYLGLRLWRLLPSYGDPASAIPSGSRHLIKQSEGHIR